MKKIAIAMAALVLAMAGCQKEPHVSNSGNEIAASEKVYMKFKIQAVDTRSGSDGTVDNNGNFNGPGESNSNANPDYEVGKDYENDIKSVQIVLKNDKKIVFATASEITGPTDGTWLATFNSGSIVEGDTYDVYIYANCNASQDVDKIHNASISDITKITGTGDSKQGEFWMTNAYEPISVKIDKLSTNPDEPTDLKTHYVERCMARFDYMAVKSGNKYDLTDVDTDLSVTLTDAAIINHSKNFYLLRHATKLSNDEETITVGYPEISSNYVVDTDWAAKKSLYAYYANKTTTTYSIADYFDAPLGTEITSWTSLSSLTEDDEWADDNTEDDKPLGGGTTGIIPTPNHEYTGYKIFGYAKENTPPNINSQIHALSTGIIFKGKLAGTAITNANGDPIYAFEGKLYGTWEKVVDASKKPEASEAIKHYVNKFGESFNLDAEGNRDAIKNAGFTVYEATDNEYVVHYYYWNRHNDNGNNKEMGDMEFAVVRNNVYKLCVDYISKLGHPEKGVDPDPVDPEDPNESGEYYFGVSVKVVPWVVRVNHIGW